MPIVLAYDIESRPVAETIYLLGAPKIYARHGVLRFIAPQANTVDIETVDSFLDALKPGKNEAWLSIILPHREADLHAARRHYPQLRVDARMSSQGRLLYWVARPER